MTDYGYIHRSVPVEDIKIKPGDGRTVEAYAAVFDSEAEIRDHEGHYLEVIDKTAFTRAINRAKPQGGRDYWLTKVFYNHGLTLHGTPSERFSTPVGVTENIESDTRGVLTVTRYANTPLGDEILELIQSGAINAQSFTGKIMRSDPMLTRGRQHQAAGGKLKVVRRLELGLSEYGPTPMPAYADAEVMGVRSLSNNLHALRALLDSAPDDEPAVVDSETVDAASDEALVADDSPARRSDRQDQFQRRLEVALRARGITS